MKNLKYRPDHDHDTCNVLATDRPTHVQIPGPLRAARVRWLRARRARMHYTAGGDKFTISKLKLIMTWKQRSSGGTSSSSGRNPPGHDITALHARVSLRLRLIIYWAPTSWFRNSTRDVDRCREHVHRLTLTGPGTNQYLSLKNMRLPGPDDWHVALPYPVRPAHGWYRSSSGP